MKACRRLSVFVIGALLLCACSENCGTYQISTPNSRINTEAQYSNSVQHNSTVQLSEEDIQNMNDHHALFAYSDEGYVTFLVGRYSEDKIEDYEDAVASLNGVAALIGLSEGSEFFCVYGEKDNDGYTYYTFQQRYGGYTLKYATLRVVVDPQGYTAGLSSSFTPNIGIAAEQSSITAEEAEDIVRSAYQNDDMILCHDSTKQLALTLNNQTVNCFAVYTSSPNVSAEFDMLYLEHFVAFTGEYLTCIPTSSLNTENTNAYKTDAYFENLTAAAYTGTVTLYDGTVRTITVPVAYNSKDGKYYLADIDRKIMVADCYDFNYEYKLSGITSPDNSGWQDSHLLAYANYIQAYDFYASMGIYSVDGFGTPILITVDWCDKDHNSVNNACYYGVIDGWACFGVSRSNRYCDALDIVVHEFTHGITANSIQGSFYQNETGAINEAYSDIMGNLIEMRSGATDDTTWLVGENSGTPARCMSDPGSCHQPEYFGDIYYLPEVYRPDYFTNDYGGVHMNNSLASNAAYLLHEAGMSLEDECSLYLTSIELMTPYADYDDLYTSLIFSCRINGLNRYEDRITEISERRDCSEIESRMPGLPREMAMAE